MIPDRGPLSVPRPFSGASGWVQSAYQVIAPQVADFQPGDVPEALHRELNLRRLLDEYLRAWRSDCRKMIREWEHRADLACRRHGKDSPEFLESQRMATDLIERLDEMSLQSNRAAIKTLGKVLAR